MMNTVLSNWKSINKVASKKSSARERRLPLRLESLESRMMLDGSAPTVDHVSLSGTDQSEQLTGDDGGSLFADDNLSFDPAASLDSVAWTNVDKIGVTFSEAVQVGSSDLELRGVDVLSYSFTDFAYDAETFTAEWTLSARLDTDNLLLILSDSIQNNHGMSLDGEWPALDNNNTSGQGDAGGDFALPIKVMPGDLNSDKQVDRGDIVASLSSMFSRVGDSAYSLESDLNADGIVNLIDVVQIARRFGDQFPDGDPVGAPPVVVSQLASDTAARGETNSDHITSDPEVWATVYDGDGVSRVWASIDDASESSFQLIDEGELGEEYQMTFTGEQLASLAGEPLADGEHVVYFQAEDTAGNISNPFPLSFVLDTTAPDLIGIFPGDGAARFEGHDNVLVRFSEPVDASTLTEADIQIVSAGAPETPLPVREMLFNEDGTEVTFSIDALTLPVGINRVDYQIQFTAAAITDLAGHPIGGDLITSSFTVIRDLDPGDTLATALDIGVPDGLLEINEFIGEDALGNDDPVDVYEFTVNEPTVVRAALTDRNEGADIYLLADLNDNGLKDTGETFSYTYAYGANNLLVSEDLLPGTYYIWIERYQSGQSTPYTLTVTPTGAVAPAQAAAAILTAVTEETLPNPSESRSPRLNESDPHNRVQSRRRTANERPRRHVEKDNYVLSTTNRALHAVVSQRIHHRTEQRVRALDVVLADWQNNT